MFEDTKLVNRGTFEDFLKIVLIKTSQKVCSNIISEIGQMRGFEDILTSFYSGVLVEHILE